MSANTPRVVVITGSARGIGLGLAQEFLQRGHSVVISDLRLADSLEAAQGLGQPDRVDAHSCDVSNLEQVHALWRAAVDRFGRVDIWINNAGVGSDQSNIIDTPPVLLERVIDTNIKGVVHGTQVALQGMKEQSSGGAIYNTAGFGSNGFWREGMTIYGTSKRAVAYFSRGVAKEMKDSTVLVGWLNPGMVITPLVVEEARLMPPEKWAAGRRVFNLFGETVETTAKQLVDRILANQSTGVNLHLLPPWKMLLKALRGLVAPRDLFKDHGV